MPKKMPPPESTEITIEPLVMPASDTDELQSIVPTVKGECAKAYKAFLDFCITGFSLQELRSAYAKQVAKGLPVPTTTRTELANWHDSHNWVARRVNYDLQRVAGMERDFLRMNERSRQSMTALKAKMLDRTSQMLEYPIEQTTVTESILVTAEMVGKEIPTLTVVQPADWNMNTTATMLNSIIAADKADRSDIRFMVAELKKQGFKVTAADGTPIATATDMLEAQD
jgi:hypothetical protein